MPMKRDRINLLHRKQQTPEPKDDIMISTTLSTKHAFLPKTFLPQPSIDPLTTDHQTQASRLRLGEALELEDVRDNTMISYR